MTMVSYAPNHNSAERAFEHIQAQAVRRGVCRSKPGWGAHRQGVASVERLDGWTAPWRAVINALLMPVRQCPSCCVEPLV